MDYHEREDLILSIAAYLAIMAVFALSFVRLWTGSVTSALLVTVALFAVYTILQVILFEIKHAYVRIRRALFAIEGALVFAILAVVPEGSTYVPILLSILIAQLFFSFDTREASAWTIGYMLALVLALLLTNSLLGTFLTTPIYGSIFLFVATVTMAFRREHIARARSDSLLQQLEAAHAQLREYATRVEELAVAEERTRLAREIHDSLGHHLTLLSVQLQAASKLVTLDPPRAATEIENARAIVAEALRDVRQSVSALRATTVQQLHPAEAVPRLIQEFADTTGIVVNYQADDWQKLDFLSSARAITIYRTVQEGLTIVQKHAHASRVDVKLTRLADRVRVQVADNGVGLQPAEPMASGFGLMGLRERVELLGGSLTVQPHDGAGFELCMELPLQLEA